MEIIAPGHCTGEPTFAALKQAFGDHYIYAGLGTSFATGSGAGAEQRRGEAPALDAEDLVSYRRLAARGPVRARYLAKETCQYGQ